MQMINSIAALMKGKLSEADQKAMKKIADDKAAAALVAKQTAKQGDLGKSVTEAATPFSYLLNMAKQKKAK